MVRHFAPSKKRPPTVHDSLVTLALQNSLLALVMHYSRVSTPPGRAYSAGTAVLLNEIFKGLISLSIAFSRIDASVAPPDGTRLRRLARDVFSPDCWKLSIPAILYGQFHHIYLGPHPLTSSTSRPE